MLKEVNATLKQEIQELKIQLTSKNKIYSNKESMMSVEVENN